MYLMSVNLLNEFLFFYKILYLFLAHERVFLVSKMKLRLSQRILKQPYFVNNFHLQNNSSTPTAAKSTSRSVMSTTINQFSVQKISPSIYPTNVTLSLAVTLSTYMKVDVVCMKDHKEVFFWYVHTLRQQIQNDEFSYILELEVDLANC